MLSPILRREHDSDDAGPWASVMLLADRIWQAEYPHGRNADRYLHIAGNVVGRAQRLAEGHTPRDVDDELTANEIIAGIAALHLLRAQVDELEADLLDCARKLGIRWEQLASAMRVSDRRAAHKRATRLWGRYPRRHDRWLGGLVVPPGEQVDDGPPDQQQHAADDLDPPPLAASAVPLARAEAIVAEPPDSSVPHDPRRRNGRDSVEGQQDAVGHDIDGDHAGGHVDQRPGLEFVVGDQVTG